MRKIVWDLDDVLIPSMKLWYRNSNYSTMVEYSELKENPPNTILNIPLSQYLDELDSFRFSSTMQEALPNLEIYEWFCENGNKFNHYCLTSRPLKSVPLLASWTLKYFGKWIRSFNFVPSPRSHDQPDMLYERKSDVIERLGGVDYFIDDTPDNFIGCEKNVKETILFPQPWNNEARTVKDILNLIK